MNSNVNDLEIFPERGIWIKAARVHCYALKTAKGFQILTQSSQQLLANPDIEPIVFVHITSIAAWGINSNTVLRINVAVNLKDGTYTIYESQAPIDKDWSLVEIKTPDVQNEQHNARIVEVVLKKYWKAWAKKFIKEAQK